VAEESTELVEASSDELISRQVLMVEEGEDDGITPNDKLDVISKMRPQPTPATKTMPIVRHGGP
jgi:hypothetical protein